MVRGAVFLVAAAAVWGASGPAVEPEGFTVTYGENGRVSISRSPASEGEELPQEFTDREGTVFRLLPSSVRRDKVILPGDTREITVDRTYEAVPVKDSVPDTLFSGADAEGGKAPATAAVPGSVSLMLAGTEESAPYWAGDVRLDFRFRRYGAEEYRFGDVVVPADALSPDPAGLLPAAAERIGADGDTLRLTSCAWEGEPYRGEDGTVCRDAAAFGERLVRDVRARYTGRVKDPDRTEEKITGSYLPEETAGAEEASAPTASPPEMPETPPESDAGAVTAGILESPDRLPFFLGALLRLIRAVREILTVNISLILMAALLSGIFLFIRASRKAGERRRKERGKAGNTPLSRRDEKNGNP